MAGPQSKEVVERFLRDVLNGADPEASGRLVGNELLKQRVASLRAAFPDLRTTTRRVLAERDLVAVHLTGRGTHQGMFQGCPATGREWSASCTAIYRVEHGRIVDFSVNWDWLSVMEQLGTVHRAATASS
jgi:predicted ester cyclase